jgi:hypothetical protein
MAFYESLSLISMFSMGVVKNWKSRWMLTDPVLRGRSLAEKQMARLDLFVGQMKLSVRTMEDQQTVKSSWKA